MCVGAGLTASGIFLGAKHVEGSRLSAHWVLEQLKPDIRAWLDKFRQLLFKSTPVLSTSRWATYRTWSGCSGSFPGFNIFTPSLCQVTSVVTTVTISAHTHSPTCTCTLLDNHCTGALQEQRVITAHCTWHGRATWRQIFSVSCERLLLIEWSSMHLAGTFVLLPMLSAEHEFR